MTKIVFFGNEQLSSTRTPSECHTFNMLISEGFEIELLIIKEAPQRSRKARVSSIVSLAEAHNVPIARVTNKQELNSVVCSTSSEVAVLAAFGMIIPSGLINHFKYGIINIHPSSLPEYRGTTPIETAILNGDDKTGVSIMQLTAGMDSGPIYGYGEVALAGTETKAELTDNLDELGASLLKELMPGIIDGSIIPQPQNEMKATLTKPLSRTDSLLDFNKPAQQLEREIRAYADWPGSRTTIAETEITVIQATAIAGPLSASADIVGTSAPEPGVKAILFVTSNGYLRVTRLKPAGKAEMTAQEFINGYLKK